MMPNRENNSKRIPLTPEEEKIASFLDDVPLLPRPWEPIAREVDLSEDQLLIRLRTWKESGLIRFIRGLWNNHRIGYRSSLLAVAAETDQADELGESIAKCPFVSHDFLRTGAAFNIWFTLICPVMGPSLETIIDELQKSLRVSIRRFDTVRSFKISFRTLFHHDSRPEWEEATHPGLSLSNEILVHAIDVLQNDLPLVERPFDAMAQQPHFTEKELLEAARTLKQRRILRRLGVIWDFQKFKVMQNVMCAWQVPEAQLVAFGQHAADHPQVSHCYQRIAYADWPWQIYTMIHGKDRPDCLRIIDAVAAAFPNARYLALWTQKEYKQMPIRYDPEKIILD